MNILFINTTYQGGGAEKVTRQLLHGYDNTDSITTHLIVGRGDPEDNRYSIIYDKAIPHFFSRAYGKIAPFRSYDRYATNFIIDFIKEHNIDIVHLQNIHGNYMGIQDVKEISKHARVIWTLHDMWALTGHCAHPFDCTKWIEGNCSKCPRPETYPAINSDVADQMLKAKAESFTGNKIIFVSPSNWLRDQFKKSYLKTESIAVINNGVDVDFFKPEIKSTLKIKYELPLNKNIVLFAASNLNSQFRSFSHLLEALEQIPNKSDYCLVVLGECDETIKFNEEYEVKQMGYISDENVMKEIYALSDVYVTPSLADNFPCTTIESFACGTPVIAFASGGLTEQIDESTGWLVPTGDSKALAEAISDAFSDVKRLSKMSLNCRLRAVNQYSEEDMLKKYHILYYKVFKGEV